MKKVGVSQRDGRGRRSSGRGGMEEGERVEV